MERETKQLENELDHEKQITCSPASCGTGWRPGCNHDPPHGLHEEESRREQERLCVTSFTRVLRLDIRKL